MPRKHFVPDYGHWPSRIETFMPEKSSTKSPKESGHEVFRLPPYHCELDAFKLVWQTADLKNFVAKENTTCSLETVEKLFRERRLVLTSEFCGRCVEHVKRVEEKYSETDRIVDLKIDQLLITTGRESSSDSECNWYGSSEDELN